MSDAPATPDVNADWWGNQECANYLKIKLNTWTGYVSRGDANVPPPEKHIGGSPAWRPKAIIDWKASRPGRGRWRGDES